MPVIAVVNRKGGSGKSTVAAHLAAWYAHKGNAVMLGDVDRQQSTRSWLRRRDESLPAIAPWTVDQNILRVPTGITHVVLDTPGGMHGFDLARMVMFADAIVMPVCGSSFDRESAAACHAELMALPRVATGRCKLACIGMRIDARTRATQVLQDWAADLKLPFLGILRETQLYVQCLERGMTIFDLPSQRAAADVQQWQPILDWLSPQAEAVQAKPATAASARTSTSRVNSIRSDNLMAAQKPVVQADRMVVARTERAATTPVRKVTATTAPRQPQTQTQIQPQPQPQIQPEMDQQIPSFLKLVKC
jgi:chromosome partitioning protein